MAHRIISFGEVLWDVFPDGENLGGAPANFACHAKILGADATIASAVGDDRRGRDAINQLAGYGLDVSLLQVVPSVPTGTVGVELDDRGKPRFTIHSDSAWDQLTWSDELGLRVAAVDAVYFGTLGQRSETSRQTIRKALHTAESGRIPRVLDINLRAPFFDSDVLRESIQLASILKLSDDELIDVCAACDLSTTDTPDATLRRLLEFGELDIVVMTRGADGALLVTAESTIDEPGIAASVVDTVGAGDSFTARFMLGELRKEPRDQILKNACKVASAVCAHPGAIPHSPNHSVRPI